MLHIALNFEAIDSPKYDIQDTNQEKIKFIEKIKKSGKLLAETSSTSSQSELLQGPYDWVKTCKEF